MGKKKKDKEDDSFGDVFQFFGKGEFDGGEGGVQFMHDVTQGIKRNGDSFGFGTVDFMGAFSLMDERQISGELQGGFVADITGDDRKAEKGSFAHLVKGKASGDETNLASMMQMEGSFGFGKGGGRDDFDFSQMTAGSASGDKFEINYSSLNIFDL